ncbi:hypothetical protein B9Z55_014315 [Caenorhabditis nigoni]|uniref:Uncharacterized protein n=1 Tax=Caenorhabditis nigoni TaxID=1611254 RepID=A0A2G5U5E4_9PELO|nr:hypothetical protein B9Z55_014315 [Caenorhabditis nigoni]
MDLFFQFLGHHAYVSNTEFLELLSRENKFIFEKKKRVISSSISVSPISTYATRMTLQLDFFLTLDVTSVSDSYRHPIDFRQHPLSRSFQPQVQFVSL